MPAPSPEAAGPFPSSMPLSSMHPCPPLLAALLMIGYASAQAPEPPERPGPPPVFAMFDTDRDGQISEVEIEAAGRVLAALDRDGDGRIGPGEFMPAMPGPHRPPAFANAGTRPERRPPPPLVMALDADQDGKISAAEIQAAPSALETLDRNGDGELTPEELRPAVPPPGEGGPHEQGRTPGPMPHPGED